MGYQTYHTLEVYDDQLNFLPDSTENHAIAISIKVLDDNNQDLFNDWWKWYECKDDMISHSLLWPDLIFCITGEGEERDDNWKQYYKNGKVVICEGKIEYQKFELESLL